MDTIKQIAEENSNGIHSLFNACMHKAECCSKADEIADLKRQLEQRARHRDKAEAYVVSLSKQLAEYGARESKLREFVQDWLDRQGTDENYMTAKARSILALPHDDTALREYRDAVIAAEREACAKVCESPIGKKLASLGNGGEQLAAMLREMKGGA